MAKQKSGLGGFFSWLVGSNHKEVRPTETREEFVSSLQIKKEFDIKSPEDLLRKIEAVEREMLECDSEIAKSEAISSHFSIPIGILRRCRESQEDSEEHLAHEREFAEYTGIYNSRDLEQFEEKYSYLQERGNQYLKRYVELGKQRGRMYKLKENIDKGFMFPDANKGRVEDERK